MPDWKTVVKERLAPLHMAPTAEANLVEELALHLEDLYRELRSGGASEEEAFQSALSELGNLQELQRGRRTPAREPVPAGDVSRGNWLEDLWRDLRYTIRGTRKSPLFVLFVVMTLALGIGANSAVFTLINTLILNPLPVPNSSELSGISATEPASASRSAAPLPISWADLKDYESKNKVFRSLSGYTSPRLVTRHTSAASERIFCEFVTSSYFSTLGLTPAKGRFFSPGEATTPGASPVLVMNYGTWKTRFGGAGDIIGKTLRLNNTVFTVIGVAPPLFIGVNAIFGPDLWIPATMTEQLLPDEIKNALSDRGKTFFQGIGRLRPGLTRTQAQADMTRIAAALAHDYPETNEGHTVTVRPVRDLVFVSATSGSAPILFGSAVLLIVVGIVLLIACSNVANLLLARSASRQQEIAVRLAMGASRQRLMRQLLTESMFLALLSGLVGLSIGYLMLHLLWSFLPFTANFIAPKFDATVFVFALIVSLATGFVFGIIPAFRASGGSVEEALREEARTTGRNRGRITLANALLVGQVAFSFLLLMTATLFLRSIGRAYDIDPGFQTKNLALFMTNPGQTGYSAPQTKAFYKDVRERLARVPGVQSVSWASNLPLWAQTVNGLRIDGRQQRSQADKVATILNIVDRGFFETAGVAIRSGRPFTDLDREGSSPVAIVNEKLAHDYWPAADALGKRILLPGETQMRQIVGIAGTANYTALGEPPQLCVYVPLEQKLSGSMTLYVRSTGDPRQILNTVQSAARAAGPGIVVGGIQTGRELIDNGLFQAKMGVVLLSAFGLLALGLACIGLYGIMAYSASQRKREIGLRMALGAAQASVIRLILKQGMSLVATGLLLGLAAALLVGRLLSRMLYGVSATDPLSVAGAALVMLGVALLACYLPARWASRVDPLVALREG